MDIIQIPNLQQKASRICLGTWAVGGWMWSGRYVPCNRLIIFLSEVLKRRFFLLLKNKGSLPWLTFLCVEDSKWENDSIYTIFQAMI
ncbi:hypothetical protein Lpar_2648 [Legionella parisiensis]|uniref:Uncharacterized protein n=1 Tax=Legionella parisiensis TaxID=45071 RepID=A0A1E5JLV4_9GAMM|nr:hypothetical protein Lpar_2648 [Legionella parisiensis]OEH45492.1 hypothetical protein lpari_03543 [Legionella parisiensis]STX76368.1 Uncharacterised protein [Legionella parisiensis]